MIDQGSLPGRDVSLRHNIQTDSEALSVNKANVYRSDGFRMESYFHSAIHLVSVVFRYRGQKSESLYWKRLIGTVNLNDVKFYCIRK